MVKTFLSADDKVEGWRNVGKEARYQWRL